MIALRTARVCDVKMAMARAFGHAAAVRNFAENVLLVLDFGGITGVGECVPRPYVTGETPESAFARLAAVDYAECTAPLAATSFEEAVRRVEALACLRALEDAPCARCALELALLDAVAKRWARQGGDVARALDLTADLKRRETTAYTIARVMDTSVSVEELLRERAPIHHLKVKVGCDDERDRALLAELRRRLPPETSISVDVNMAWSPARAARMFSALAPLDIAWYEEPLEKHRHADLRALRRAYRVRVMLDESMACLADLEKAAAEESCDLVNIRISKCGGLLTALRIAERAKQLGVGFQLGAQVGEMGPLFAAGRSFIGAVEGAVAYEAGQADRWFVTPIVDPPPAVDRERYVASDLNCVGFGELRATFETFVRREHVWTARA